MGILGMRYQVCMLKGARHPGRSEAALRAKLMRVWVLSCVMYRYEMKDLRCSVGEVRLAIMRSGAAARVAQGDL